MSRVRDSGRLIGIDVARFLALAGMAATHIFAAFDADRALHPAYVIAAGRASALFALLAGVSLALANGAGTPPFARDLRSARAGVLARAGFLFVLGLLLGRVDSPPLVILSYYGLLFAVGTLFLGLTARTLAWLAAAAAVATPVASHLLRQTVDSASVAEPGGSSLPITLLLTGTYPVLTWVTYLLAGLAIGRTSLRRPGSALRLIVLGAVLAVTAKMVSALLLAAVGGAAALRDAPGDVDESLAHGLFGTTPAGDWRWLTVSAPHSGATFDLMHTVGTSMAVIGGCLLLARLLPRRVLFPLGAAGSMTLTLYCAHVLALTNGNPLLLDDRLTLWLAHVAVALVAASLWLVRLRRGPLEAVAAWLDRSARTRTGGRREMSRSGR